MVKRTLFVLSAATIALVLMAGTALAHFCYNGSRSDKGNQGADNSAAWMSVDDFMAEIGLCEEGVEHVKDGIEDEGFPRNFLIHGRTVMAQGAMGRHDTLLHDGRGVDHLTEADFALFEELVGEAFAICSSA